MSKEFQQAFENATKLYAQGDFAAAENAYKTLVDRAENRELVLRALVELYMQTQRPIEVIETLKALIEEVPDSLLYCSRLAELMMGFGQLGTAIAQYQEFLQGQPGNANAYFNVALLYKKGKRYADALNAYEQAIAQDIDHVEEVYSNMGVLYSEMRQRDKASDMYERALEVEPEYIPALFNLAGLFEESGDRREAIELYERILSINPRHWESLSRLAYGKKVSSGDSQLMDSLKRASEEANDDKLGQESIYFALGKAFDDLQQYEEAFTAYTSANKLGKLRNPPYVRSDVEHAFDGLMGAFSAEWISTATDTSRVAPVFICGMFRSGSSLVEQILSAHASITAGGELDYLQWLVAQKLSPFPERAVNASSEALQALGNEYLTLVRTLFPSAQCITDKQPDNFLYLGLIKILFPSAKIIYTSRNPLDNCLSVNFQQLGGNLSYATDLEDTAHYYKQHERLMKHWSRCFPDNIFTVEYDQLVSSPEPVLRGLLDFLGLEWDEKCLAFQQSDNLVKTASVWQVREKLHTNSSGRWRNYKPFVQDIQTLLGQ
jgi:tetratricopeptide (TPR) repeat protein